MPFLHMLPDLGMNYTFNRPLLDGTAPARLEELSTIAPRIKDVEPGKSKFEVIGSNAVRACWPLASGQTLALIANFGTERLDIPEAPEGALLYTTADALGSRQGSLDVPPLTTAWFLK